MAALTTANHQNLLETGQLCGYAHCVCSDLCMEIIVCRYCDVMVENKDHENKSNDRK